MRNVTLARQRETVDALHEWLERFLRNQTGDAAATVHVVGDVVRCTPLPNQTVHRFTFREVYDDWQIRHVTIAWGDPDTADTCFLEFEYPGLTHSCQMFLTFYTEDRQGHSATYTLAREWAKAIEAALANNDAILAEAQKSAEPQAEIETVPSETPKAEDAVESVPTTGSPAHLVWPLQALAQVRLSVPTATEDDVDAAMEKYGGLKYPDLLYLWSKAAVENDNAEAAGEDAVPHDAEKLMRIAVAARSADLLQPAVNANVHSDDHVLTAEFNAAAWFAQASVKAIRALAGCGWKNDYPADEVAIYEAGHDGTVKAVFDYCEARTQSALCDTTGFECSVDESLAMSWLAAHHPYLHDILSQAAQAAE